VSAPVHGGDLDRAVARFGGDPAAWIDLSTGINRRPWPVQGPSVRAWQALPTNAALGRLTEAARAAYGAGGAVLPVPGAQAAIGALPRLWPCGRARVLGPTYTGHAAALAAAGWIVEEVTTPAALAGADLAVIVNPNNPDGRALPAGEVMGLHARSGRLLVDESFADVVPCLSVAARTGPPGLVVLRSFGKFYGLAGLRLGFVLADDATVAGLGGLLGPWPVSGPAAEIGAAALADGDWAEATRARLAGEVARLDELAAGAGWRLLGGTALFRLYETGDADRAQARLARHLIWSRRFDRSPGALRLGLPGGEAEWARLAAALGR